jgi:beta-lactamase class A
MMMKKIFLPVILLIMLANATAQNQNSESMLLQNIQELLGRHKGFFAIAYKNVQSGETILWNENVIFHAASTMKTPVMVEVYKQIADGSINLSDSILVKNEFKSIVDGSLYQLNPVDDSQQELYQQVGKKIPIATLVYEMIINSSNLATNMVIEMVDAKNVTATMRQLGANDMQVLRGVEDSKAYALGLNNATTAFDLMVLFDKMSNGKIISQKACDEMIRVLLDQQHNTLIPAKLPKEVKVAHKTGTITGVHHDSGIVFLPDGRKYVLVMLSKNLENVDKSTEAMAEVSALIYQYFISK